MASHGERFRDLRLSLAGIIFLGTPHQGSDAAGYGKWLARVNGCDTTLLDSLTRNSQILDEVGQDFETGYSNIDIICFYEEKSRLLGVKVCMHRSSLLMSHKSYIFQLVDSQSASLNGKRSMYLTTDHSGLNKFYGLEDENFLLVLPEIQRIFQTAQIIIESQFSCMHSSISGHGLVFFVN